MNPRTEHVAMAAVAEASARIMAETIVGDLRAEAAHLRDGRSRAAVPGPAVHADAAEQVASWIARRYLTNRDARTA